MFQNPRNEETFLEDQERKTQQGTCKWSGVRMVLESSKTKLHHTKTGSCIYNSEGNWFVTKNSISSQTMNHMTGQNEEF